MEPVAEPTMLERHHLLKAVVGDQNIWLCIISHTIKSGNTCGCASSPYIHVLGALLAASAATKGGGAGDTTAYGK
jgi:hypothetical protein